MGRGEGLVNVEDRQDAARGNRLSASGRLHGAGDEREAQEAQRVIDDGGAQNDARLRGLSGAGIPA